MFQKAKLHLLLIGFGTLLSGASLASILTFTNPKSIGLGIIFLLYLSLFLTISGLGSFIGIITRIRKNQYGIYVQQFKTSIRQGIFISILVTSSLFLSSKGLLVWWVELTLILLIVVIEIFYNIE